MKKEKKALVALYALILVFFVMVFSYLVLLNMEKTNNNLKVWELDEYEKRILEQNADLNFQYAYNLNSDWGWFTDNYGCPNLRISFFTDSTYNQTSKEIDSQTILFIKDENGEKKFYCKWMISDLNEEILLPLNYNSLNVEEKQQLNSIFDIWNGRLPFDNLLFIWDQQYNYSSTSLEINHNWHYLWFYNFWDINNSDGIDDNLNSDDYSDWINGTSYPSNYFDNDADATKNILWIILENKKRVNIFANTKDSNDYLDQIAYIDHSISLFKMENATFKIKFLKQINWQIELIKIPKSGQKSIREYSINWNEIEIPNLDFKNNYYQIFVKSESSQLFENSYNISEESWAYINPIWKNIFEQNGVSETMLGYIKTYVFNHSGIDILKEKYFWVPIIGEENN